MGSFRLTEQSRQDLQDIWDYIAKDSPNSADKVLDSLRKSFSIIGNYPHIGQKQEGFDDISLRIFHTSNYTIVYHPKTKPTEIYRVLSSYRDTMKELG